MNRLNLKTIIGMMALSLNASANDPDIVINSRTDGAIPEVIVRSIYDFEQSISLKLKTNPLFDVSSVLINAVSKLELYAANGVRVTSGFDIDPHNNLVIGFSGGTTELIKTTTTPDGVNIVVSFKDAGGKFVSPPKDSLAVYNLQGEKLCFEYKDVIQAPPKMVFILLLDRSISMTFEMDEVKRGADTFLKALPSGAQCAVASFNHGFAYHNERFENCNTGDFKLGSLVAEGGTDLFVPLLRAHESLGRSEFTDYQKAVIVITDGQVSDNKVMKQAILSAKKDSLTFAYFLGQSSDEQLKDIADGYLHNPNNAKQSLGDYFDALNAAYRTQKVLSVKRCSGGNHVK